MSQNPNESPIDSAKKLVANTRTAVHASRVEHATATAQLEAVRSKYLADSSAPNQKAVISAEDALRFCELRMTDLSKKLEAASAELARLERESRLAAHAARQADVSLATFDRAIASTVSKHADLLSKLDAVISEERRLISGFLSEQTSIARDSAALSVPVPPALDFARIVQSRLMAARGSQAGEVLATVWGGAAAPAGVDSQAALAAILGGVDASRVASLVAKLKDSTARALVSARAVLRGGYESPRGEKSLTAVGRFNAALSESHAARRELCELMPGADAGVKPDALISKIEQVGAGTVHAAFLALRATAALTMPGYPTAQELEAHRNAAAAKIIAELEAMGLGEYVEAARPSARAHTPATIAPQGVAFAEVSL